MKANHGWFELLQRVRGLFVEGCARWPTNGIRLHNSELFVVRRQQRTPGGLTLGAGVGLGVAEEVDVKWSVGFRADIRQFRPHVRETQRGARERSESPSIGYCDR